MSRNRPNTDGRERVTATPEPTSGSVTAENSPALCRFERPETYTFETYSRLRDSVDRLVVDVVEVTDACVTVDLRYRMTTRTIEETVVGSVTDGCLRASLRRSLAGGMFLSRPTAAALPPDATRDGMTVGDVWPSSVADTAVVIEITGTDTHAGVEGYTFSTVAGARNERVALVNGCVARNLALPLHWAETDERGVSRAMTLVEYERT